MTDVNITSVSARPVIAPLARPIKTASGEIPAAPLVLIDVATSEGITGCAYVFCYTPLTMAPIVSFVQNFEEVLLGKAAAPRNIMADTEAMFRLPGRQGLVGMALAGIDMALWDALGKLHNRPVVELLGGTIKPLMAYDSYGILDPIRDGKILEKSVDAGFKGIKIKLNAIGREHDIETVSKVRNIIGDDIELMVDFNQSLTVPEALYRIAAIAEYNIHWVEEPVPAEDLGGHAAIRCKSRVSIQTGENWWFPEGMALSVAANASDLAMIDIMKIGGVSGWLRAMGQAEAASLPVSSHLFNEASAHVLAITPTAHWLEYLDIASGVLQDPPQPVNGYLTAQGPGLGIVWDESAITRLTK